MPQVEAPRSSAVEGAEAAISVWLADESNRVSGQGASEAEEEAHADLEREAKNKELDAWKFFWGSETLERGRFRQVGGRYSMGSNMENGIGRQNSEGPFGGAWAFRIQT